MTTITTEQIKNRLSQSLDSVKPLKSFEHFILESATDSRCTTVIRLEGLELVVVVFTLDSKEKIKADTAEYKRAVLCVVPSNTRENKLFYF